MIDRLPPPLPLRQLFEGVGRALGGRQRVRGQVSPQRSTYPQVIDCAQEVAKPLS
jgi:hypothetical protein